MSWVSNMGRRFIQAYTEGLVMTCPMHRAEVLFNDPDGPSAPAAIDRPQDNVQATLRPEYAGSLRAQPGSSLVH